MGGDASNLRAKRPIDRSLFEARLEVVREIRTERKRPALLSVAYAIATTVLRGQGNPDKMRMQIGRLDEE